MRKISKLSNSLLLHISVPVYNSINEAREAIPDRRSKDAD